MSIIRVIDFETTAEPPDCDVIEAGGYDVSLNTGLIDNGFAFFLKPNRSIDIGARAVHHLSDEDVACGHTLEFMANYLLEDNPIAFAAHNAVVERGLFKTDVPWICTMKCAMRLIPEAGKFSNQFLRYYLKLDLESGKAFPPHRAAPDAYVTAHILKYLLGKATVTQLIQITSEKVLLPTIPFGSKYKGMPWSTADTGYLQWILRQDFDENVVYTAQTELNRRTGRF